MSLCTRHVSSVSRVCTRRFWRHVDDSFSRNSLSSHLFMETDIKVFTSDLAQTSTNDSTSNSTMQLIGYRTQDSKKVDSLQTRVELLEKELEELKKQPQQQQQPQPTRT